MREVLNTLIAGQDLTFEQAHQTMAEIMSGVYGDAEIGGFLSALAVKGETAQEIAGFVTAMREKMVKVPISVDAIDMCGTGGDGMGTFNISTAASFVVAGAGIPVAKHGNRSISSSSGSADVLGELGVDIEMGPEKSGKCIDEIGIGFLFAPAYHPAMRHVMPARRALGVRTVFNILGPLCNPAGVRRQVIGLFDGTLAEKLTEVLQLLKADSAMLVHGDDGMDEITSTGDTRISMMSGEEPVEFLKFHPSNVGYKDTKLESIRGGDPAENATIMRGVFNGEKNPYRDVVVLNAAAGIIVGGKAEDFSQGIQLAEESIDSGSAKKVLNNLVDA